jgi:small-conductance mechanosensitive channel
VQNWYLHNRRGRVRVDVGVAYGSDPNTVRDILLRCAEQHPGVSGAPRPSVLWTGFGDSSIDFELRAYVRNYDDAYTTMSELRFAIFDAFKEAGIAIPFPQRDVHLGPGFTSSGDDAANTDINNDIEEAPE